VSTKLWGGNYTSDPDAAFWAFNRSFPFDRRLLVEEITASRAYARALGACGALPAADAAKLDAGLAQVLERAKADSTYLDLDSEDVHSFVETRLAEIVGELASQGHLGRSRNEQAVVALRLFTRGVIDRLSTTVASLVVALVSQGEAAADAVMPGFTHTRAAEPITFGHWAGAHAWAFVRDFDRLRDARARVDVMPLGSGALAGTALPLDREALARDLGFAAVSENALDAVTDRDFAAEVVFACAQLQTHMTRVAEDLIWLSGPEFGFFTIPEAFTTGSSLMPQKKNPDGLELIRGKAGRVDGDLVRLLVLMKGLAAGYQKDQQEDKEAVFDAVDTTLGSVAILTGVISGLVLHRDVMRKAGGREEMIAASLAVALARHGLPFRKAHEVVGSLVGEAQKTGASLRETAAKRLPVVSPEVAAQVDLIFDPDHAVKSKAARGGTAPDTVRASLKAALSRVHSP
jgi:argininosuccinate lyase